MPVARLARHAACDQPQQDGAGGPFRARCRGRASDENAARNSSSPAPRVAAKGDGLALLVAAIGIAAIAGFEIEQAKDGAARFRHSAAFRHFRRARRPASAAMGLGNVALARSCRRCGVCACRRWLRTASVRPVRTGKPHPPGAADRGTAGIGGPEFRVDRLARFPKRTCPWRDIRAARPNARAPSRSIAWFVLLLPSRRHPELSGAISDIPK